FEHSEERIPAMIDRQVDSVLQIAQGHVIQENVARLQARLFGHDQEVAAYRLARLASRNNISSSKQTSHGNFFSKESVSNRSGVQPGLIPGIQLVHEAR